MSGEPNPFSWPPQIHGKARLTSYVSKSNSSPYPSFEEFLNDDKLYNEVNWRWLRNGAISQNEFDLSTRQNYERNVKERHSFLGLFQVGEAVSLIRTGEEGRVYLSLDWSGAFKDWVDVEINLYKFKNFIFFEEKETFAAAYTSGTRRVYQGSMEHVALGHRPGDTHFWHCKGEFETTWNERELRFIGRHAKARNGVKNNGFGEEAVFLLE